MTDEELAALFAEKVLGWRREPTWATWLDEDGRYPMWRRPWQPCTDLNQAMLGVEQAPYKISAHNVEDGFWTVYLLPAADITTIVPMTRDKLLGRAIVKACLKAVGVEVE